MISSTNNQFRLLAGTVIFRVIESLVDSNKEKSKFKIETAIMQFQISKEVQIRASSERSKYQLHDPVP